MLASAELQSVQDVLPLVIDLDGTLIKTDILDETFFALLCRHPLECLRALSQLPSSKAQFKHTLAASTSIDPALLPYDEKVLELAREASAAGRPVYLASATNEVHVAAIAAYLGIFDGWFASDQNTNLSGRRKAARLVEVFGERGFEYVGNDTVDLEVWSVAGKSTSVAATAKVKRQLDAIDPSATHITRPAPTLKTWLKLLRVHQYAKNALIFVPVLAGQAFAPHQLLAAVLAFVTFSLVASSVYILNDVVDLEADRVHPTKRNRPLANGTVPIRSALLLAPALFLTGLAISATISLQFCGVVLGYFAVTTAYSFYLKRKLLIDVVALASLYTARVIAGAVATGVGTSEWLLGFSVLIFTALALIKRYVELAARLDRGMAEMTNRDYRQSDMPIVASLAAGAGYSAVVVLGLYISSAIVPGLYSRPFLLWGACPLLVYWLGRVLILAHRRELHDDPVVFAMKDRVSIITVGCVLALVAAAI